MSHAANVDEGGVIKNWGYFLSGRGVRERQHVNCRCLANGLL